MKRRSRQPEFGLSLSQLRCEELRIDCLDVLSDALRDLGVRRFRFMSYWSVIEPRQGEFDFALLDAMIVSVAKEQGRVTLCLGKRQPRWPECHMPDWARQLPKEQWYAALYAFIERVVQRYKNNPAVVSWQLENEALLKSFGYCPDGDFNRQRLQTEAALVKRLDPGRPLIMTLSDSWGVPIRGPRPDMYAMSLYRNTVDTKGIRHLSRRPPAFYSVRASLIRLITQRPVFIHELQAEPWFSAAISTIPIAEQKQYMNAHMLESTLRFAVRTGSDPIDIWGLEWWYYMRARKEPFAWNTVRAVLKDLSANVHYWH